MADFNPPFAENGGKEAPTTDEQSLGFACGPASRELFNYLFNLMQGQVKSLADEAGVSSMAPGDPTVVKRSVLALIAAATGGSPAGYMLADQFLARHPTYPEVLNTDGKIVVTSPSTGVVRIPGGVDFLHRGFGFYTTAQEDLNTTASKTYHLRWNPNDGFTLNDLADTGTYNPSALPENDISFDSDYDDMLVARIVTNSSNVATITNLANKHRLVSTTTDDQNFNRTTSSTGLFNVQHDAVNINWSRTPKVMATAKRITRGSLGNTVVPEEAKTYLTGTLNPDGTGSLTARTDRYALHPAFVCDLNANNSAQSITFQRNMWAEAS